MDLQSGKLYWPTTIKNKRTYEPLQENISCDVLIIGGGSSGAQCAYYLADKGVDVVVVDRREIGAGSTSTNTALIQYAGDKTFVELINTFGEDNAVRHLKLCEQAMKDIEATKAQLPIDIDFTLRDSLYFASYLEDVQKLDEEHQYLQKHGFDVLKLDEEQIGRHFPFKKRSALYYKNDAQLNPLAFSLGLMEYAHSRGVRVFEHTAVQRKKFEHNLVHYYTTDNYEIKAKHVIIAAGYEGLEFHKEKNATISSSYAIVTSQVKDFSSWYKRALIWESARPYIYMRTTPDDRVIIGGLDETTTYAEQRDGMILGKRDKLIEEFNKLFPDIHVKADFYLGAFYGGTHDGLPMLGIYEQYPNCYFLYGYGDNGTVYSMVLSKIIRDLILNGSNDDLNLYLQPRVPMS